MTPAYRATADRANSAGEQLCTGSSTSLHPIAAVMRVARSLWPSKTALELSARTGACERTAKYWLARRCNLSAENLAELIRSDAGLSVLEALMGDARPDWYAAFRRRIRIESLEAKLEELARETEAIKRERRP